MTPQPRIIILTATELMVASYVGSARNVQSMMRGWQRASGIQTETWSSNIEGAAGEMAVAKLLNIYWQPVVGKLDADDVGPYQVRTNMSRKLDDLCLRPRDREDRFYISVLSFAPEFHVLGFIKGADGKREQWLRDGTPGHPQCYYVPRAELRDLSELEQHKS
jgi:hypothetical protein